MIRVLRYVVIFVVAISVFVVLRTHRRSVEKDAADIREAQRIEDMQNKYYLINRQTRKRPSNSDVIHQTDQQHHDTTGGAVGDLNESDNKTVTEEQQQRRAKKRELQQRLIDSSQLLIELSRAEVDDTKNELGLIFSAYKLLTPKQRKEARRDAMKVLPAETVNEFFDKVDNAESMTEVQIRQSADDLQTSREVLRSMRRQLNAEFAQLVSFIIETKATV